MSKNFILIFGVILCSLFLTLIFKFYFPIVKSKNINTTVVNNTVPNNINNSIIDQPYTCLESKVDDSDMFGYSLAVSKNFLAVSDPKANRVVIYGRQTDDSWMRLYEIYPPKRPITKQGGYVFEYDLALKDNLLLIHAYDFKGTRGQWLRGTWLDGKNGDELVYLISLGTNKIKESHKIKLTRAKLYYGGVDFLEDKIALVVRVKKGFSNKFSSHLFLIEPSTRKLVKDIKFIDLHRTMGWKNSPDKIGMGIDSNNSSVVVVMRNFLLPKNTTPLSISADGKVEKINLDKKAINSLSINAHPVISNTIKLSRNFLATSVKQGSGVRTILWKRFPQPSFIDVINRSIPLDIKDSLALVAFNATPNKNEPDYVFIQVDDSQITTKSKIRWQRAIEDRDDYYDYLIGRGGLIDSDSLLLTAYGSVVRFPFKNLPSTYEIKYPSCRSK